LPWSLIFTSPPLPFAHSAQYEIYMLLEDDFVFCPGFPAHFDRMMAFLMGTETLPYPPRPPAEPLLPKTEPTFELLMFEDGAQWTGPANITGREEAGRGGQREKALSGEGQKCRNEGVDQHNQLDPYCQTSQSNPMGTWHWTGGQSCVIFKCVSRQVSNSNPALLCGPGPQTRRWSASGWRCIFTQTRHF